MAGGLCTGEPGAGARPTTPARRARATSGLTGVAIAPAADETGPGAPAEGGLPGAERPGPLRGPGSAGPPNERLVGVSGYPPVGGPAGLTGVELSDIQPTGCEPAAPRPAGVEPAGVEPAGAGPVDAEPARPDPAGARLGGAASVTAGIWAVNEDGGENAGVADWGRVSTAAPMAMPSSGWSSSRTGRSKAVDSLPLINGIRADPPASTKVQ